MRNRILILVILIFVPYSNKGQEREWLLNKDSVFTLVSSEHFKLYSFDGHLTTETKLDILKEREVAFQKISDFFEIKPNLSVNIFLFRNEQLKYNLTGHRGLGWGFDSTIVEVFNDSFRMDPYHELVHILGYTIHKTPALIDEGTAVYLSQLYGDNAFSKMIGYPTKSINEILLLHRKTEGLINISTLLLYDKIGNSNNFVLEYCTSASFVEFLIRKFGKQKFLELYKSISTVNNAGNEMIFEKIYGAEFNQIENAWTKQIRINKL
ncbi:hypothetical protein [Maribellus maritimus]|uniref:hypothetical protein n=1 Tax=Maribellus maritimus TaxID=2870838 RepID=UPI001EEA2DDB|nr:hypothetical protein [Maribellus maritimus]MCG6187004.1 hypothetical protein [Maribellus maritimus]